ncbi:MAG: hypothetical protein RTU30_16060, partial [Candidatus Thorarchaeota archaeon]
MNKKSKASVLLFVGIFVMSLGLVPAALTPTAAPAGSPVSLQEELTATLAERLEDVQGADIVDPILRTYMASGDVDDVMVTTTGGDVKALMYLAPDADMAAIKDVATITWNMDMTVMRVISVDIASPVVLKQLESVYGVQYIQADTYITYETPDVMESDGLDMFDINDVVGATAAKDTYGYDGTGVIIGTRDTGADYSHPDMQASHYTNATGYPANFDPSSMGLTEMYMANNTVVSNVTAWLEMGYLLTYEMGGNYYLNTTGWDPVLNNEGGHRNLMGLRPYGNGYPEGNVVGFIGLYEWAWGIDNGSEFVYNEMWKDWEIPAPGA